MSDFPDQETLVQCRRMDEIDEAIRRNLAKADKGSRMSVVWHNHAWHTGGMSYVPLKKKGRQMSGVLLSKHGPFQKACMASLKSLYPQGVREAQQHRDLIKVYLSGWLGALKENGVAQNEGLKKEAMRIACDPNWWPDNEWAWWL